PCTPNRDELRGFSSTFSFATRTSLREAAISSSTGPIIRQGPHHGAQKSTMVDRPSASTRSKFASVTSIGLPVSGVLHLPQTAFCPLPSNGIRFEAPHDGQAT